MSSTNRGAKRQPNELYETPAETMLAMLPSLSEWQPNSVLDPPYSLAEQFVRRAYETAWMVVALLPLAFLGSEDGESLIERVDMPDVYLLSTRQSFIGGTAGPHDSAWMVWDVGGNGGRIRRLKSVCRAAARKEE